MLYFKIPPPDPLVWKIFWFTLAGYSFYHFITTILDIIRDIRAKPEYRFKVRNNRVVVEKFIVLRGEERILDVLDEDFHL